MSSRTLIYDRLTTQHNEVSELIEKMKSTKSDQEDERRQLLGELRKNLLAHAHAEQDEVYPRFRKVSEDAGEEIADDLEEHQEIEKRLEALSTASVGNAGWLKKLKHLEECIEHHVDDEENELFPEVKKHLSDKEARSICQSFDKAFQRRMKRQGSLDGELKDMTRDELYELAQEQDLRGRSQMKKDELIQALRR